MNDHRRKANDFMDGFDPNDPFIEEAVSAPRPKAKRGEVMGMVPAPKMPRRETWLELPPEYAGFRVKIWLNPPAKAWKAVWAVGEDKETKAAAEAALRDIVMEHNGWADVYGVPFPPADTAEFWDEIPDELAAVVMISCQLEMGKLGNSLLPKNRR
jgi:hypothetical protein